MNYPERLQFTESEEKYLKEITGVQPMTVQEVLDEIDYWVEYGDWKGTRKSPGPNPDKLIEIIKGGIKAEFQEKAPSIHADINANDLIVLKKKLEDRSMYKPKDNYGLGIGYFHYDSGSQTVCINVKGVTIEDVCVTVEDDDPRPYVVIDHTVHYLEALENLE